MTKDMIIMILLLLNIGCISKTKIYNAESNKIKIKVLQIEEKESVYLYTCLSESDTLFVVSLKSAINNKFVSKKNTEGNGNTAIVTGSFYQFQLRKIAPRVSSTEQLGRFIIVQNDTLWMGGPEEILPAYYFIENGEGPYCNQCKAF